MYLKLFAIPCYDRTGDYMDKFWRFVRNTGQTKEQDWVELTGLSSTNDNDMLMMRRILHEKKQLLLEFKRKTGLAYRDSLAIKTMKKEAKKQMTVKYNYSSL